MKKILWLAIAGRERPDVSGALATLSWMAKESGALCECYVECRRDGRLFASTGSTILGGRHLGAFNYLHAAFDARHVLLGETTVFASSIAAFDSPVIARADDACGLYRAILEKTDLAPPSSVLFVPDDVSGSATGIEIGPYVFPDVVHSRALCLPASAACEARATVDEAGISEVRYAYLGPEDERTVKVAFPGATCVDALRPGDDYASVTRRIASRWRSRARGVAFGDPDVIRAQVPWHCRRGRVAMYAPKERIAPGRVRCSAYTEEMSPVVPDVAELAEATGERVVAGRQTGDGDILEWSKRGVCIQIVDPNRPAFPVVEEAEHAWASAEGSAWDDEPDDDQLREWLRAGAVLATLIWHSGEVAHNEAMLNLLDLSATTGLKMGIGVHAARYETCPQAWELLSVPVDRGGVRGLVEPLLHSGGMGVLAEINCPAQALREHCDEATARIAARAGRSAVPRGYYAFLDSDLGSLASVRPELYDAVSSAGLEYAISSVAPGRNRAVHLSDDFIAINQSCRVVHGASPFVRITSAEDLNTASSVRPGWLVASLDAPVIAFDPYVWRHGSRFMAIVDRLTSGRGMVNVTPRVVARYARMLAETGVIPLGAPQAALREGEA